MIAPDRLEEQLRMFGYDPHQVFLQGTANIEEHRRRDPNQELDEIVYRQGFLEGLLMAPLLKQELPEARG